MLVSENRPSRNPQFPLPSWKQLLPATHTHCLGRVKIGAQFLKSSLQSKPRQLGGGERQEALIRIRSLLHAKRLLVTRKWKLVLSTHLVVSSNLTFLGVNRPT